MPLGLRTICVGGMVTGPPARTLFFSFVALRWVRSDLVSKPML